MGLYGPVFDDDYCSECIGHCYIDTLDNYKCVGNVSYFFCGNPYGLIWVLILCFWIMNLFVWMYSRSLYYKTPLSTIIVSFFQLTFLAFIIGGSACIDINYSTVGFIIPGALGLFFFFIFERCNACCGCAECCTQKRKKYLEEIVKERKAGYRDCCHCECCVEPMDPVGVVRELKMKHASFDEMKEIILNDAKLPPKPFVNGQAYHYEGSSDDIEVVTATHTEPIIYQTWEERGTFSGKLNKNNNIVYSNFKGYTLRNLKGMTEEATAICRNELNGADTYISCQTEVDFPNMSNGAVYLTDGECTGKCLSSCCCAHILYNIAMFFGFAPVVDLFWRARFQSFTFSSDKYISGNNDFRSNANEIDLGFEKLAQLEA